MNSQIDISKHPYGLAGGAILSGSVTTVVDGFWYHPITNDCVANIKFSNLSGSFNKALSIPNGTEVYGYITEVTQSSGVAVLYSGSANIPTYSFG